MDQNIMKLTWCTPTHLRVLNGIKSIARHVMVWEVSRWQTNKTHKLPSFINRWYDIMFLECKVGWKGNVIARHNVQKKCFLFSLKIHVMSCIYVLLIIDLVEIVWGFIVALIFKLMFKLKWSSNFHYFL